MTPDPQKGQYPPVQVFALAFMWAVLASLAPVGVVLLDWLKRWDDPPDKMMLIHLTATCAISGGVGFWRKHRALLKLPPYLQAARNLQFNEKLEKSINESSEGK